MKRLWLVVAALAALVFAASPLSAQLVEPPAVPVPAAPEPQAAPAPAGDLPPPQTVPAAGLAQPVAQPPQPLANQAANLVPPPSESSNPLLRLFDINQDGVLSADEVATSAARLWELDRNRDAELTPDELALVLAPRWDERRRAIPGVLPVEPSLAPPGAVAPPSAAAPPGAVAPPGVIPPAGPATGRSAEPARVEIYPLHSLDPNTALATLQQLLRDRPEVRLTIDARTRSLLAYGPGDAHALIRKSLAEMLESGLPEPFGQAPGLAAQAPMGGLPIGPPPRVIPLYNARARDVLRTVKQIYRDRLFEPRVTPPADLAGAPAAAPQPQQAAEPAANQMVIGLGADPNTLVVTAQDDLFFEVLDLIERLDRGIDEGLPPENR